MRRSAFLFAVIAVFVVAVSAHSVADAKNVKVICACYPNSKATLKHVVQEQQQQGKPVQKFAMCDSIGKPGYYTSCCNKKHSPMNCKYDCTFDERGLCKGLTNSLSKPIRPGGQRPLNQTSTVVRGGGASLGASLGEKCNSDKDCSDFPGCCNKITGSCGKWNLSGGPMKTVCE